MIFHTRHTVGHLYRDITYEITLPTCTIDGTQYTMEPDGTMKFNVTGGTAEIVSSQVENGVMTVKVKQAFYANSSTNRIGIKFPAGLESIPDPHVFKGHIKITSEGYTIINTDFSVTLDNSTLPIWKVGAVAGRSNIHDLDTVQYMGTYCLGNIGGDSGPVTFRMEFDAGNTGDVGITSFRIMNDPVSDVITVKYTLVDENGNYAGEGSYDVANNKSNTSQGLAFNRTMLPAEQRQYYFKTIEYTLQTVKRGTYLYHTSATSSPNGSGGTIWGKVLTDTIPSVRPYTQVVAWDGAGNPISELSAKINATINADLSVPYGVGTPYRSSNSVLAGNSVTIGGDVFVAYYPYTYNNCLDNIRIGLLLPVGVTVSTDGITASLPSSRGGEKAVAVNELLSETVQINGEDKVLWTIVLDGDVKIGYYNDKLSAVDNGANLRFRVRLDVTKATAGQTLSLREVVYATGDGRKNSASGSYKYNAIPDILDLNGNGSTTDNVGSYHSVNDADELVTIIAAPAELEITDSFRNADGSQQGSAVSFEDYNDVIYYDLNVKSISGGSASDFFYLIPVSRAGNATNSEFLQSCPVDLKLVGAAAVNTVEGSPLKVLYTTKTGLTYESASKLAASNWVEADAVTDWSQVTMLKVVAADQSNPIIQNNSRITISVPFSYKGDTESYIRNAGMTVSWKSRGYYHYTLGANSHAGEVSTAGGSVTLHYTEDPVQITLTAAKDGEPHYGSKTATITLDTVDSFINSQIFTIRNLTANNLTLVPSSSDFEGMDTAQSNSHFGITVKLNGGSAVDLLTDGTVIGSQGANSGVSLTFEIFNGNAISEIAAARTVTLRLVGDKGVVIPVEIIVARELAAAEASDPAIVAGKQYIPFNGRNASVTVSRDSAFTAQFVATDLVPENYGHRTLSFGSAPAAGTTVALIDWTVSGAPGYYHYTFNGSQTAVTLDQFVMMGGSARYTYPAGDKINETLLFIVDFPDSGESLRENTISLTRDMKDSDDDSVQTLKVATVAQRTFGLTASTNSVVEGELFELTYTTASGATGPAESRYEGRKMAFEFTAAEGSGLPADLHLVVGKTSYYANAAGQIIIPLDAVQGQGGTMQIAAVSAIVTNCTLEARLWASATETADKPFLGEMVAGPVSITVTAAPEGPSLKVESMSDRLLHIEELKDTVSAVYAVKNVTGLRITLEVQMKEASGYVTMTNVLTSVNGSGAHTGGVYDVTGKTNLSLKISQQAQAGTYRLLLSVTDPFGNVLMSVPYNFLIVE